MTRIRWRIAGSGLQLQEIDEVAVVRHGPIEQVDVRPVGAPLLSYANPGFPGSEPVQRRRWLAVRCPGVRATVFEAAGVPRNDAAAEAHRRFCALACREAHRVLVCDTSPLAMLFCSLVLFGRADPELEVLAARRYDLTVLCAPDFPFVQDGMRRDAAFRARQHAWTVERLGAAGVRRIDACGRLEARTRTVLEALSGCGR